MKSRTFSAYLSSWIRGVERFAPWIVLLFLPLTLGALYLTGTRMGINTELTDMISDSLEFHRRWKEYKALFPQLENNIIVVVDGDSAERVDEVGARLERNLRADDAYFSYVLRLKGHAFFREHFLLYMHEEDVGSMATTWESVNPLAYRFARDPTVRGFLEVFSYVLDRPEATEWIRHMADVVAERRRGEPGVFRARAFARSLEGDTQQFIEVMPRMDYTKLLPGRRAVQRMRRHLAAARATYEDVHIDLTGQAVLSYEEMRNVFRDAVLASLLSLFLVGMILFWAIRSLRLIALSLLTLITGLVLTAGWATLVVGHLNLISIAFAVLFIGLGVDFSIHLCLRYRELVSDGEPDREALRQAVVHIGHSLVLCTLTTAAGFFAFVPTTYAGTSELGIIAGSGMFINLIVQLTLLPALLTLFPLRASALKPLRGSFGGLISNWSHMNKRAALALGLTVLVISLPFAMAVSFDPNPLHLQDPTTPAYQTYRSLLKETERSPWTIKIVERDPARVEALAEKLEQLPEVSHVVTIQSLLPEAQDRKLSMVSEMSVPELREGRQRSVRSRWRTMLRFMMKAGAAKQQAGDAEHKAALQRLEQALSRYLQTMDRDREKGVAAFQEAFVNPTSALFDFLRRSVAMQPVGLEDLPPEVRARFVTEGGWMLLEVFPSDDLMDMAAMKRFAQAVLKVAPHATDDPVTVPYSGDAVVRAFVQATATAALVIGVLLLLMTRSFVDTFLVGVPIGTAGIISMALMTAFDASFNFANIIVIPLLLGIGVDSGIHLVHRFRVAEEERVFDRSTSRGIFFSALTTVCTFGTLALSTHRGTSSMGILLTMSTLLLMVCTFVLLPPLLRLSASGRSL